MSPGTTLRWSSAHTPMNSEKALAAPPLTAFVISVVYVEDISLSAPVRYRDQETNSGLVVCSFVR
jgi:hypothetical protein